MTASTRLSSSSCRTIAPARRAERRAHGHLARPCRRSRQQQIGDVRAGDEQHEADRAHHRPEHGLCRAADVSFGEGFDADADDVLVGIRGRRRPAARRCRSSRSAPRRGRPPGRRRPNTLSDRRSRGSPRRPESPAVHTSVLSGKRMPSGMTPTMVAGCPSTRSRRAEHVRVGTVPVLPEV